MRIAPVKTLPGDSEQGATMVEFALVCIFLLFIFGAFVDIGMGIHRWAMLKQVTTESTRQIVARLQTHRDCTIIRPYLEDYASKKVAERLKVGKYPSWSVTWHPANTRNAFPMMTVRGLTHTNCYFLCMLSRDGWPIQATSEIIIERSGLTCPSFTIARPEV